MEETNLYNKIKELEDENALLKEKLKNYTLSYFFCSIKWAF